MRKRRPQPAMARSGQAGASALMIASMISWPQWLVESVTGARPRVHDRALARDHRERAEGAVVLRRLGIDQVGQRHHHRRAHVRVGGVDEAVHLLVAVGQVDFEVAAALGDLGADMDVLEPWPSSSSIASPW